MREHLVGDPLLYPFREKGLKRKKVTDLKQTKGADRLRSVKDRRVAAASQ